MGISGLALEKTWLAVLADGLLVTTAQQDLSSPICQWPEARRGEWEIDTGREWMELIRNVQPQQTKQRPSPAGNLLSSGPEESKFGSYYWLLPQEQLLQYCLVCNMSKCELKEQPVISHLAAIPVRVFQAKNWLDV